MKQWICTLIICLLLTGPVLATSDGPATSAKAVAVMHVDTGAMLHAENADAFLPIASTTKIMTALVVLERCALDEAVKILPEDTDAEGSSMYLEPGKTYTVRELLYGLMLASGNDAALALARHCGGTVEGFVELMNAKAADLGLKQTHFCNPNGLDAPGHGSTARELAKLACAAMENADFRKIVGTNDITINNLTYVNHNKLLRTYDGCTGVKTGYTESAGRILVSCAEREGMRIVCVTLSDPDDWADHTALLDWAFDHWEYREVTATYELAVLSGTAETITAEAEPVRLLLPAGEAPSLRAELPRFVFAPLRAGEAIGTLTAAAPDGTAVQTPLICHTDVPADEKLPCTPFERLRRVWRLAGHGLFAYKWD